MTTQDEQEWLDEIEALVNQTRSAVERHLRDQGSFIPFGLFNDLDGAGRIAMVEPDESGDMNATISKLKELARRDRDELSAVAIVCQGKFNGSPAAVVQVQHRGGTDLAVIQPYTVKRRIRRAVTFGQPIVESGSLGVW